MSIERRRKEREMMIENPLVVTETKTGIETEIVAEAAAAEIAIATVTDTVTTAETETETETATVIETDATEIETETGIVVAPEALVANVVVAKSENVIAVRNVVRIVVVNAKLSESAKKKQTRTLVASLSAMSSPQILASPSRMLWHACMPSTLPWQVAPAWYLL